VYEVTQAEYEKVIGENGSEFKGVSSPVEQVSWDDATEFCKRLSAKEGKTYRLPTEAEWEYACRAGTTTRYSFGDDPASLGEYAWYGANSDVRTHSVGEKKPNAWGLYDMHGNMWEWCADSWAMGYYAVSPTDDPPGPETAARRVFRGRVFRGGCWGSGAAGCRSAYRGRDEPQHRRRSLGFRVAADPASKSSQ
jgi:formylglycine-generating enzyme required for sulfatase activity